ncbi:MAG: hypothetical protein ACYT04_49860 [Nostoc sp.]
MRRLKCDVYDGRSCGTCCIRVFFNTVDNWRKRSLTSRLDSCDRNSGGIAVARLIRTLLV